MKQLTCDIKIGTFKFYKVHDVQIVSTYQNLTERCTIVLPRNVSWKGKSIHLGSEGLLKEGFKVNVKLGYDDENTEVFRGYLKRVGAGFPIALECENEGYTLKKTTVKPKEFKTAKLRQVLQYILPSGIFSSAKIADINLGRFIIADEVTAARVIEEISKDYHIYTFFRDGKLYSGLVTWPEYQQEHTFKFGRDIKNKHRLKYIKKEDVKIRVKAVSILDDNTKLEVEVGDESGTLHNLTLNYIDNQTDLKQLAEKRLESLKYTGMHGSFKTFGVPAVKQGDIVNIEDKIEQVKEREGRYRVEKVVTRFGTKTGYEQTLHIGKQM